MRSVSLFRGVFLRLIFSLLAFFSVVVTLGQGTNKNRSDRIADCFGAVSLPNNGFFSIAFPEEPGVYLDLNNFKTITSNIPQQNTVWLKFDPGFKGNLKLQLKLPEDGCHLVVFNVAKAQPCETILKAATKVVLDTVIDQKAFTLENQSFLNRTDSNKVLYFYFNYVEKHRKKIDVESRFQPQDFDEVKSKLMEQVDQRFDKTKPTYRLSFRDLETGLPVNSKAIIKGSRSFDAMYTGTDLLFSLVKKPKFDLRLDAIGYFPLDTSLRILEKADTHQTVYLEPVAPGKQISLEGIEFLPETADFVKGTQKKLVRIRDFLALNANLKIEVQGHVHQLGENNFWSKRLSRLRAKAVADYLINAGIEENRIEYKGYGNTQMIFLEPENEAQMQANRRVEIHIK